MRLDKEQRKLIKDICSKYNINEEQALDIIKAPMRFIRKITSEIKLTEDMSEEEFEKKTFNFNIPHIGKLYADYHLYKKINNVKRNKKGSGPAQSGKKEGIDTLGGDDQDTGEIQGQ